MSPLLSRRRPPPTPSTLPLLPLNRASTTPTIAESSSSSSDDDTPCEPGVNVVSSCSTLTPPPPIPSLLSSGTQSRLSATTNLAKCICGAGSFALPHVFLDEGILGGTLALLTCGSLAISTMTSLSRSRQVTGSRSYVSLAQNVIGGRVAGRLVFVLTMAASLGVCASYLIFIGEIMASLCAVDGGSEWVRGLVGGGGNGGWDDVRMWEMGVATLLVPLCLLRSYAVFAFTSALGVVAVLGGIVVTLASGIYDEPGGGVVVAVQNVMEQRLWPESLASAFGGSFGTVAFLFCINFLTFPIMNSMREEARDYPSAIATAVWVTAGFNIIFAALCVGFYGEGTEDLVLANLGNGLYLSALKLLLVVDLFFTFPIVFSSGRQIAENAIIGTEQGEGAVGQDGWLLKSDAGEREVALARAGVAAGGVFSCFCLAQIGGFGVVANLVGGVAQGTLAFIMPPLIAVRLARRGDGTLGTGGELGQWALGIFGIFVVLSTSYFTIVEVLGSSS